MSVCDADICIQIHDICNAHSHMGVHTYYYMFSTLHTYANILIVQVSLLLVSPVVPSNVCLKPSNVCLKPSNVCLKPSDVCLKPSDVCLSLQMSALSLQVSALSLQMSALSLQMSALSLQMSALNLSDVCLKSFRYLPYVYP